MSESDALCPKCGRHPMHQKVLAYSVGHKEPLETGEIVVCPQCDLMFFEGRWINAFKELMRMDLAYRALKN